jgi:thiamine pyrophosphate-dependent acetolactate synthase large subunit-like protein
MDKGCANTRLTDPTNQENNAASRESQKITVVRTGGQLFVQFLHELDVQFVFGTTGAGMAEIQDAMVVVKPPKWIQGLHEFPTVNAAAGYALASESLGIALIDRNVGTQNASGAFYCAYMNEAPVIVFASKNVAGVPVPTDQVEYHYVNYEAMLAYPWIKWNSQLESIETMADDMAKLFQISQTEPRGTTYFTLRQDIMAKRLEEGLGQRMLAKIKQIIIARPSVATPRAVLDGSTVEKIYNELLTHSFPEIIVSHLGKNKSGLRSLVNFARTFGIPVSDYRTFMNFPITDALHVGFTKMTMPPKLLDGVDLVVALEAGLLPHQRFGNSNLDAIDLTADPFHRQDVPGGGEYGSTLFPAIIRAVCDVAPTLDVICDFAARKMTQREKSMIRERIERAAKEHNRIFDTARREAEKSYTEGKLNPSSIGFILNKKWPKNGIWVDGSITPRDKLLELVELSQPGTYFSNPSFHLGAVVGMAYGVSLASRRYVQVEDRGSYKVGRLSDETNAKNIVICTTGDGDAIFGNLPSALWTCSHYGLGVIYIILNNACWGIEWPPIEKATEQWAKKAKDYEFLDLDAPRIEFTGIASSCAVQSQRVKTPKQFEEALEEGINLAMKNKPMLIDVILDKYTGEEQSTVI